MQSFFTICATNYLAFARQLGESVLTHQPGATFTIWLLDRSAPPCGASNCSITSAICTAEVVPLDPLP